MGIKNFYLGFKKTFSSCITKDIELDNDVLIIELNGLFYSSCKKLYFSKEKSDQKLKKNELYIKLFREICENLKNIIEKYGIPKKIFLVVDGVAGMMKNNEQRQRRYKNSFENKYDNIFDLNSFSPGTKLLHFLTKYIDWFIRQEMNNNSKFSSVEIYFSNEKVPGEGEYKIIQFIKNKCSPSEKIYIYTCDSDMIILSIILHQYSIFLIRNSSIYGYEYVDIKKCRNLLLDFYSFDDYIEQTLKDIYLLFSLLGNDYITNSPCIYNFSILYDEILPLYKKNRKHFFQIGEQIHLQNFCSFLSSLGNLEEKWIKLKYKQQNSFFPDSIFLQQTITNREFSINEYKNQYQKLNDIDTKHLVCYYLASLQNVCNLFFSSKFNWGFFYPSYMSPFLSDFIYETDFDNIINLFIKNNDHKVFQESFYHLITIFPPQSKYLLPNSLQNIFIDLKTFFPSYIEIDLTGKYKIWEGIVKLPIIKNKIFQDYYTRKKIYFSEEEHKRNIRGKSFFYSFHKKEQHPFYSFYGKITNNKVVSELVDI